MIRLWITCNCIYNFEVGALPAFKPMVAFDNVLEGVLSFGIYAKDMFKEIIPTGIAVHLWFSSRHW